MLTTRPPEPESLKSQKKKVRGMREQIKAYEALGEVYLARHLRSLLDYETRHLWQLQSAWERSRNGH